MGRKHAGLGIASFVISAIGVVGLVLILASAVSMGFTTRGAVDPESPETIVVGLLVVLSIGCVLLGLVALAAVVLSVGRTIEGGMAILLVAGLFASVVVLCGWVVARGVSTAFNLLYELRWSSRPKIRPPHADDERPARKRG